MKKIIVLISFFMLGIVPVFADTMVVQAVTDISTANPEQEVKVRVLRNCTLADMPLKIGDVLEGKMIATDPKRLKRDATFTFYPLSCIDLNGKVTRFSMLYYGKFSAKFELDVGKVAESAVVSVANHFVKGIGTGFYAVQGAVKNKDGNPIKSAVVNVYENSILSYANKGEELTIPKDSVFGLKFSECENEPLSEEEKEELQNIQEQQKKK